MTTQDVDFEALPELSTVAGDDQVLLVDISDTTGGTDGTVKRTEVDTVLAGATDQTARDSATAAQTDIDSHESSTHNTDQTARDAADTAQADIDDHEANHPSTLSTMTSLIEVRR